MRRTHAFAVLSACLCAGLLGCDEPYADDPAIDPEAPVVRITAPARGASLGDLGSVLVTGAVIDDSPIRELTVAGVPAELGADGTFAVQVPLDRLGTTHLSVVATDRDGNIGRDTRAVEAGPRAALAQRIPDALTAAISDTALAAVGNAVATTLVATDLGAWIAPHNPVISKGAPDGPDCLFGEVSIGALAVAGAEIQLVPTAFGLELSAELSGVRVPMQLRYAALCVDGASGALATARKVTLAGRLSLAVRDGRFELRLLAPQVRFTELALSLDGLPGEVVNLLDLGTSLGPVLAWAVERLAAPILNDALAGLDGTTSAQVLGKTVDLALTPTLLASSPVDLTARIDSSLRTRGEPVGATFVHVPGTPPPLAPGRGVQVAVAAGALNQLLASFWAAGGLRMTFDLTTGDYAGLGKLYDRVVVEARLPPSVRADGAGVRLLLADILLSFQAGEQVVTQLAINGSFGLAIERAGDGALRLVAETPRAFVDIVEDGVVGGNPLARSQLETLTSFALERLSHVASGLVGALPLPRGAGPQLSDAHLVGRGGYLLLEVEAR